MQLRQVFGTMLLVIGAACSSPVAPEVPMQTDRDGIGSPLGDACANLRRVGCTEGFPANGKTCFEHLTARTVLVDVPAACLINSVDRQDARACGTDSTLRVRCLE